MFEVIDICDVFEGFVCMVVEYVIGGEGYEVWCVCVDVEIEKVVVVEIFEVVVYCYECFVEFGCFGDVFEGVVVLVVVEMR